MSFMKFNLSIKEFSGGLKSFIDFTARFPKQKRFLPISAFIDTGSAYSYLSLRELKRIGISASSIINKDDFVRVYLGGRAVIAYPIHTRVEFIFTDDKGQLHKVIPKTLRLLIPAKEDEKSMKINLNFISTLQRTWHGLKGKFLSDMDIETNISNGIFIKGRK